MTTKVIFHQSLLAAVLLASTFASNAGGIVGNATENDLRTALVGGGNVTFSVSGTIVLTSPIVITNATTIDGSGQGVTISGGNAVRIFQVNTNVQFSLINLTVANGRTNQGAVIYNAGGSVLVSNCFVVGNQARGIDGVSGLSGGPGSPAAGGAIYNLGSLTLLDSFFGGNSASGGNGGSAAFTAGGSGAEGAGGVIYSLGGVAMTNCTFSGNNAFGGNGGSGASNSGPGGNGNAFGGVLYSQNVSILASNCTYSTNAAIAGTSPGSKSGSYRGTGRGGVIYNTSGTVSIAASSFSYNTSSGSPSSGGGVHHGGGSLNISSTLFAFNIAAADRTTLGITGAGSTGLGGGIYNAGNATLSDCTLSNNSVSGGVGVSALGAGSGNGGDGQGGGCYNAGSITVTRCSLSGNSAAGGPGGGVYPSGSGLGGGMTTVGSAPMVNCTVAFNTVSSGSGGGIAGGGIYGGGPFTNCTFLSNQAIGGNGGNLAYPGGTVNSIVAAGLPNNVYGPFVDLGNNTISNANPGLGTLGYYGGITPTLPLLAGNPAIDGGNNASSPATDQRGRPRPTGAASDIGAFESSPLFVVVGRFVGYDPSDTVYITLDGVGTTVTNGGSFLYQNLSAGAHSMTASNAIRAVTPATRNLSLGPDVFDADFTTCQPVNIGVPPQSQGVFTGSNVTLSVTASGGALSYQWRFNGTNMNGATSSNLTIINFQAANAGAYTVAVSNIVSVVTSAPPAVLSVAVLPVFVTHPQSQTNFAGNTVLFSTSANGSAPLYLQWFKGATPLSNDARISGATSNNLAITGLTPADAGSYSLVATNAYGAATSSNAVLTVIVVPPSFLTQPQSQTYFVGGSAVFNASVNGTKPLTYQWRKGATPLVDGPKVSGSTSSNLVIANLTLSDAGAYSLFVTNAYGSATSSNATLTVLLGFGQALGSALPWTTSGNLPWVTETGITHDGVAAAQSGAIGDSQTSVISAVVTGPGVVTFWWKVSSETTADYLRFLINGTVKVKISGDVDWQQKSFAVTAGTQLLQWSYSKDVDTIDGLDAGWLDEVRFENNLLDNLTLSSTNGFQFRMDGLTPATYVVQASSNLTSWLPISTNIISSNSASVFIDGNAQNFPLRFYRAQKQ